MKITIYELLGLVKEGKAPEKIKDYSYIYEYDKVEEDYEVFKIDHYEYLFANLRYLSELDNEVEIIEEDKKIEKIPLPSFEQFKRMSAEERYVITAKEYDLLDELIDEINNLKKEK